MTFAERIQILHWVLFGATFGVIVVIVGLGAALDLWDRFQGWRSHYFGDRRDG